ncbi:MAG: sterol desaturase family protein [Ilumatobacteraceae bacterium]
MAEPTDARATDLTTKRAVAGAFVLGGSARVLLPVVAVLVTIRLALGGWGRGDVAVLLAVIAITGFVEWFIHLLVLHASPDAWTSRRLGTGAGHRNHHLDPPELRWLMLPAADAAIFVVVLAIFSATWAVPLAWAIGGAVVESAVTAIALAAIGLAHYEWTHLLIHSAYRPRSGYYARLARNHRLHHYRNERYWLGISSNLGDRALRTLPADRSAVPLSETARTLG